MEVLDQDLEETIRVWPIASKVLSTLQTEKQFNKAIKLLDELVDRVGEKEDPLIESLIDTLGTLIKDYEDRNIPEPEADPRECLEFLMEEHNLKETDLPEIGSRKIVTEILSGKRELSVDQIKVLSKRFNVPPAVFI